MAGQLDESFILNAASWPALLVDAAALVQQTNAAARAFFGEKVEGAAVPLSRIWTGENGAEPASFLEKVSAAKGLSATLKLRGAGVASTSFNASVCVIERNGAKSYLFQLFPPPASNGSTRSDVRNQSVEINLAQ
jgi:hypothetical protein